MNDSTPPPLGTQQPRASEEFRTLRRSTSDRVVAGVLGGLGRRFDIDPIVLRITTVVLAIFGGVGVLLYALAWLLIPAEDEDASVLDRALGRNDERDSHTLMLAAGLGLVALIAATTIVAGSWDVGALLVLAAAGVYLAVRRTAPRGAAEPTTPADPAAPPGPAAPAASTAPTASTASAASMTSADPTAPAGPAGPPAESTANLTPASWPEEPDRETADDDITQPAPEPPADRRSALGPLTMCVALIGVGVLAINDVYWANVPAAMYVALPLLVVAIGLLIGTWFGRSRWLIVLGVLLTLALVPATFLSRWEFDEMGSGGIYRFTDVADVPTSSVSHGAGSVHYDLSGLDLAELDAGQAVTLTISQGIGELTVTVPENADVEVEASTGAGQVHVLGDTADGLGQRVVRTDDGPDGAGGGMIVLDLDLGLGQLEVTR